MGDEQQDPFDSLKGSDPIDPARLPGPDSPMGRRIYKRATSSKPRRPPTSRRTVVLLVLFGLLLVAAGGVLVFSQVTQPTGVVCYAGTSLDSDRAVVDPEGTFEASDCRRVWRDGLLTNPNVEPGDIPPHEACVNQEGTLVVFPTDDPAICGDLGLASPASGEEENLRSISSVRERLLNYIDANRCSSIEEAATYAEEALANAQLNQWTVLARQPSEERPCASFAIDPEGKTITVVPIPTAP